MSTLYDNHGYFCNRCLACSTWALAFRDVSRRKAA
jgi:hypothetical protein